MRDVSDEKKARSEAQRLDALAAKQRLEKERSALVASALKNIDSSTNTKRKVFDSDSDDEPNSSREGGVTSTKTTKSKGSKRPALFDSEEEDEEDNEEALTIANRHSGKKGEKLMKLEARFGHDDRFKLDDKFASDVEESSDEEGELAQEKSAQKKILERVLGHSLKTEDKKTKVKASLLPAARPFTRFDPENEEHVKWMEQFGGGHSNKKPEMTEDSDEEKDEGGKDRVVGGQFYEMDSAFADQLKEKERVKAAESAGYANPATPGFSFLQLIGRKNGPLPHEDGADVKRIRERKEEDIVVDKKLQRMLKGGMEDPVENEIGETVAKANLSAKTLIKTHPFFLTGEEPFVRSVVSNFRRVQSEEKIMATWSTYRESIQKVVTHLKRNARRNMKERGLQYNYGPKASKKVVDE